MQAALSRASLRRAAGVTGALLCLIAVALLVRRGFALGDALGDELRRIRPLAFLGALSMYVGGGVLLGLAWALLVRVASGARPSGALLVVSHLRAQLAKYLPGNVFHFAYRHYAAYRAGVGHKALAFALALESLLLITAAALLALGVVDDPRLTALVPWARDLVWAAPMLAVAAWVGISLLARRNRVVRLEPRRTTAPLAAVLAIDLSFFVLAAAALRLLSDAPGALPFGAWCGWLALAWALGYVVPGAPAGLGLREAVLVLGLTPVLGSAAALALALAYRLLTVVADAVLALAGFLLVRRSTRYARGNDA